MVVPRPITSAPKQGSADPFELTNGSPVGTPRGSPPRQEAALPSAPPPASPAPPAPLRALMSQSRAARRALEAVASSSDADAAAHMVPRLSHLARPST
mmetsp:Transcript_72414/g.199698  ORF Transcript_72414/g.199698 Transcript_72414/m.199698 type:complete len:98 (+) Transcript_72414:70-363(+)